MPRMVAPPPSGEFAIHLTQPFEGDTKWQIEILGEPNRPAVVRRAQFDGTTKTNEKTGDVPKDDVEELMNVVNTVRGFPSHPQKDVYGLGLKLDIQFMELQWSNKEEDSTMATDVNTIEQEQKDDFKNVTDSIEALARTFAKKDSAI